MKSNSKLLILTISTLTFSAVFSCIGGSVYANSSLLQNKVKEKLDSAGEKYYQSLIDQLGPCFISRSHQNKCPLPESVDLTDLRGSIDSMLNVDQLRKLSKERLSDLFADEIDKIRNMPQRASREVKRIEGYLPGKQLAELKKKILNASILKMPNPVYGSLLAGSATKHFIKAFCGPFCFNPYEFKRGTDVVKVLGWQLSNRERISLTLKQFLELGKLLGDKFGMPPIERWGKFGADIVKVKSKLASVENKIKKVDKLYEKSKKSAVSEINKVVKQIEKELNQLQNELLTPVQQKLDPISKSLKRALPKDLNSIPPTWKELKKILHVDAWFNPNKRILPTKVTAVMQMVARFASLQNAFDPVNLFNGEFFHRRTDLFIETTGLPLHLTRVYRSRVDFPGILGRGWTHNYEQRIVRSQVDRKDLIWWDESARPFTFKSIDSENWQGPAGLDVKLSATEDEFVILRMNGESQHFSKDGRLQSECSALKKCNKLFYDEGRKVIAVSDSVGRTINFDYDEHNRLLNVRDWFGNDWQYQYDTSDNLQKISNETSEVVNFEYLGGNNPILKHNLTKMLGKDGKVFLHNVYGKEGFKHDRLVAQYYNGANTPVSANYQIARPSWLTRNNKTVLKVSVTDQQGAKKEYHHNSRGVVSAIYNINSQAVKTPVWRGWYDNDLKLTRVVEHGAHTNKLITMQRNGNKLKIEFTVDVLRSEQLPENFSELFTQSLSNYWSGTFPNQSDPTEPNWEVSVDVDIKEVDRRADRTRHWVAVRELANGAQAQVPDGLGTIGMQIAPATLTEIDEYLQMTIAHEAGHWMGLDHKMKNDPNQTSIDSNMREAGNIMNCDNSTGCIVGGAGQPDIETIIDRYEKGKLNRGVHSKPELSRYVRNYRG